MITQNKKKILVVDDKPDWRRLLATLLEGYELNVLDTYESASNAIDLFDFDVAIFDLRLEDDNIFNVDGVDLLRKFKIRQPSARIVILTGYRESVRDQVLREYIPNEIFNKEEFNNDEFRITIKRLAYQNNDN